MERDTDIVIEKKNGFSLPKLFANDHITVLDLSNKNIKIIDETMKLPVNLKELNLSNNELCVVPVSVLNLENVKVLNLSHNRISYFDDTPKFSETIHTLNISNNNLLGPPYWIWLDTTKNLREINLSCNANLTKSFNNGYFEELLQYKSFVTNVILYNCKLDKYIKLISTFPYAKSLVLGTSDIISFYSLNSLEEVPFSGLDKCCDVEYLNLSNTNVYNVSPSIALYKYLKEINLSHNKLDSLPEEICSLENMETCILSYNRLYSLPEKFSNLSKLKILNVDRNELNALPNGICNLPQLARLDLYDNQLYEVPCFDNISEVDLAQNYCEEPSDEEYLNKKKAIRANSNRLDGRKEEATISDSEHSSDLIDGDLIDDDLNISNDNQDKPDQCPSSPEDWESDDYWVPYTSRDREPAQSPWLVYLKKKMSEGNFCPIDAHTVPIADQVMYQRMCNPVIQYESDGQFDDFSGDES